MDVDLRKLLTEFSSHVIRILGNSHLEERQCACTDILKDLYKILRELDAKLNTLSQTQDTDVETPTDTENHTRPHRTRKTRSQDAAPTPSDRNSDGQEGTSPKRRKKTSSVQSTDANATTTVRPKRKSGESPNYQPVVKLTRIDSKAHSQNELNENTNNESGKDARKSVSQNATDSRYANVRRKRSSSRPPRRQTVAVERSFVEDDETLSEDEPTSVKNTNQNMYYANSLYKTLCTLCLRKERNLVAHYVKQHADHEVPIARPSPTMASAIRAQNQAFELHKQKITGLCFFCEVEKSIQKSSWAMHILTHTGEALYVCTKCDVHIKTKEKHPNCRSLNFKTIFESNDTEDIATGFMCSECNYLQINKERMIAHLSTQHNYDAAEVNDHITAITLVPDLSPVRTNIRYGFINPLECYKCTICGEQFDDEDNFEVHFEDKHSRVKNYTCVCREELNVSALNCVSNHLLKHGADLYQCAVCEDDSSNNYYDADGVLNHISLEHAEDERVFQHIHREDESHTSVTELTLKKFICTTCNGEFDKLSEAMDHFKLHSGEMVDFKVFVTEKTSDLDAKNKVVRTNYVADMNKFILRQGFLCLKCQLECSSKEDILAHYSTHHPSTYLNVKLGGPKLIALDDEENTTEYVKVNEQFDRFMAYSCYWCNDDNREFISANAKGVHDHWLTEHTGNEMQPTMKPFHFYVDPLLKCNYCDVISTYKGLQEHTERIHPKLSFCFVNINVQDECPLCNCKENPTNLPAHFVAEHDRILEVNMVSPIRLHPDIITQILNVDAHKKSMCDFCGEFFDLETEYEEHHRMKHYDKAPRMREIVDNTFDGVLTSCCQTLVPHISYFTHLNVHNFQYNCKHCQVKIPNIEQAALHDYQHHDAEDSIEYRMATLRRTLWKMFQRSKLLFGNGAVLYKHNVLGSQFDDTEMFERFMKSKDKKHRDNFDALSKKGHKSVPATEPK